MRTYNFLVIALMSLFIFQGCNTLPKINDITGVYNNKWYDTQHKLCLNNDSTFIFYVKEGLYSDTIRGEWKLTGSQVLLNKNKNSSIYKTIECDTCTHTHLMVYDILTKENLFGHFKAYVKDTLKWEGDIELICELPESIDSLSIESLGYNSLGININSSKTNLEVFLSKKENNLLKNKFYIRRKRIQISNSLILVKQ